MKKIYLYLTIGGIVSFSHLAQSMQKTPDNIERFAEMATQYAQGLPDLFNDLSSEERIFIYYMYRAGLPGNRILTDQNHRHAVKMIELLEFIIENADTLKRSEKVKFDVNVFLEEAQTYLVYLWTNHGQYFEWEHANQKRTPERIGLTIFTAQNFLDALIKIGYQDVVQTVSPILPSFFNVDYEPTLCVANDIEKSAVNIYSPDFTNNDFEQLSEQERTGINSYFYVQKELSAGVSQTGPKVQKYKVDGKYSDELEVAICWLKKAHEHAGKYPKYFDQHLVKGLDYLIQYLNSGDEELFKKHSIEWAQQQKNGRVDYTFGFIETYDDPKGNVAGFQMDVTIKSLDMKKLNAVLPTCEERLPFPKKYQREDLSVLPNASLNTIAFSSGQLGPIITTAAYCLPNYNELRSKYGSKQIMYQLGKKIGEVLNPDAYRALFNLKEKAAWLKQNDPEGKLGEDIWMVHCILHETLGHGSGRLAEHTFSAGDKLKIGNKTYKIGDKLQVTSENLNELLDGQQSALEELRAEIISLYTSINCFDELAKVGLYKDWPKKIGKEKLIEELILGMMDTLTRRLYRQEANKKEITGAHALANSTLTNYILDHGGASLEQEEVEIGGKKFKVLGYKINDLKKVLTSIMALMIKVQEIKSTGDGQGAKKLIDTYGRYVRDLSHVQTIQENTNFVNEGLKATARVYPNYTPKEKEGELVDVKASWPSGIVEQWREFKELQLSKK